MWTQIKELKIGSSKSKTVILRHKNKRIICYDKQKKGSTKIDTVGGHKK